MDPSTLPTTNTLFTPNEWDSMYSRTRYNTRGPNGKRDPHVLNCTPHYLCALGQPPQSITTFLGTPKGPIKMKTPDGKNHGLTPLMIATISRQYDLAQAILMHSEDPRELANQPDSYGWTALHHATLWQSVTESSEFPDLLRQYGANPNQQNRIGATPDDLLALTSGQTRHHSASSVWWHEPPEKDRLLSRLTPEELQQKTGLLAYCDDPLYSSRRWKKLWQQHPPTPKALSELEQMTRASYGRWKQRPPKLTVIANAGPQGPTLIARRHIPAGTVIGEVSGVLIEPPSDILLPALEKQIPLEINTPYRSHHRDMKYHGNVTRWCQCGFPNAVIQKIPYHTGSSRFVLVAGEQIQLHAPIFYDHRSFGKGCQPPELLGYDQMGQFFQGDLDDLLTKFIKLENDLDVCSGPEDRESLLWQRELLRSRCLFPITNPIALLHLHFTHTFPAKNWERLFRNHPIIFIKKFIHTHPEKWAFGYHVIRCILNYEEALSTSTKLKREFIAPWIVSLIGRFSLMQILKALDLIPDTIDQEEGLSRNWENISQQIEQKLQVYDWIKDKEGPMGFKRRNKSFKYFFNQPQKLLTDTDVQKIEENSNDLDIRLMIDATRCDHQK